MRGIGKRSRIFLLGSWVTAVASLWTHPAHASKVSQHENSHASDSHATVSGAHHGRHASSSHHHYARRGISCVPFARNESGIEIRGNAARWWNAAAGVYQRGNRPEIGSVLNFRSNSHMRLGHVAVVQAVVDSRTIIIDHANWGGPGLHGGMISRNVKVIDVSDNNDWSAVKVQLVHSDVYGSVYPTYGFIYARAADDRVQVAENNEQPVQVHQADALSPNAPTVVASNDLDENPILRDLKIVKTRAAQEAHFAPKTGFEEVAEAPSRPRQQALELRIYRDFQ